MTRLLTLLAVLGAVTLLAQAPGPAPTATHEDDLTLQIVILKSQLAQALAAAAKCEAEGPQASKVAQDANGAAQALVKSLDARGLVIDPQTNTIVPKPPAAVPEKK